MAGSAGSEVRASNGLSRYSLGNQLLIAIDCHAPRDHPDLRRRLPRLPRRSTAASARARRRSTSSPPSPSSSATSTARRPARRRSSSAPSRSSTSPMTDALPGQQPVPLLPPSQPITGDSHQPPDRPAHRARGRELGYSVEVRDLPDDSPGGWCDPKRQPDRHRRRERATGQVRARVHELAHAHGLGYDRYGRERGRGARRLRHLHRLLGSLGVDVGGESIPYIAGWGEDGALDAIRAYAQTIDTIARQNRRPPSTRSPSRQPTRSTAKLSRHSATFGRGLLAPMIGQARPTVDAARHALPLKSRRPVSPGSGLTQPRTEPTPAVRQGRSSLARRRGSALPPAPPRSTPSRRTRRRSSARAHRGRLPERVGDPAPGPALARTSIFGWLYVVATRRSFRLCERDRRHNHLEAMFPAGTWDAAIADASSLDDILEAREALDILAGLPDRPRADLTLLVAGFSYADIAQLTKGAHTPTSTSTSPRRAPRSASRGSAGAIDPDRRRAVRSRWPWLAPWGLLRRRGRNPMRHSSSMASCSVSVEWIFGSWAVGFRGSSMTRRSEWASPWCRSAD